MTLMKRLAAGLLSLAMLTAGSAQAEETNLIFATGNQTNNAVDNGFLLQRLLGSPARYRARRGQSLAEADRDFALARAARAMAEELEPATEAWTKETPNGTAIVAQYKKLLAKVEAAHKH